MFIALFLYLLVHSHTTNSSLILIEASSYICTFPYHFSYLARARPLGAELRTSSFNQRPSSPISNSRKRVNGLGWSYEAPFDNFFLDDIFPDDLLLNNIILFLRLPLQFTPTRRSLYTLRDLSCLHLLPALRFHPLPPVYPLSRLPLYNFPLPCHSSPNNLIP
jgi:hypothetical protein